MLIVRSNPKIFDEIIMHSVVKFAFFILIGLDISSALALNQKSKNANQIISEQQPGSEVAPIFIKKLATDEEKAASEKEEKEREKKWAIDIETLKVAKDARDASKDAATYAGYGLFISLLAAVIAFFQWRMFGKQLGFMKSSNDTATKAANAALETVNLGREQYVATHRPWIKVQLNHAGDLKRDSDGGWRIDLVFKIKNVGNTPAQNVYPNPRFYAGEGSSDEVKQAQLKLATEYKPIVDANLVGLTIFPGESSKIHITIRITKDVAENKDLIHIGFSDCFPRLFIVGSVHYKSTLGEMPHRTGFIRSFGYFDTITRKNTLIPKRDVISHSDLRIGPHFSGDGYID